MLIPLLSIIAILATSCTSTDQVSRAEKHFFREYAKSLETDQDYHFIQAFESGESSIETLGATLTIPRKVEYEGARTLVVAEAHRLMKLANSNKELIPHIKPYPLTLDRVEMTIEFIGENGEYAPAPYIAKCKLQGNRLTFYKREPYNNEFSVDTFTEKLQAPWKGSETPANSLNTPCLASL